MPSYTRQIDCTHNIRASLDDGGEVVVHARSRLAYAPDAYVGAEIEIPPEHVERIRDVLQEALGAVSEKLAAEVDHRASLALQHAQEAGDFDDPAEVLEAARKAHRAPQHRSPVVMAKIEELIRREQEQE